METPNNFLLDFLHHLWAGCLWKQLLTERCEATGDVIIYPAAPRVTNDSKLPTPRIAPPPSNSVGILPSPEDIQEIFLQVRWCASMFETSYWNASWGDSPSHLMKTEQLIKYLIQRIQRFTWAQFSSFSQRTERVRLLILSIFASPVLIIAFSFGLALPERPPKKKLRSSLKFGQMELRIRFDIDSIFLSFILFLFVFLL
ncbi:hypothetical protein CEXT_455671 [Caerostris extrusa]|uniref:Uncharacterized protein n=1 Tax=Caerostris extrusa TaxID=172846 RepID=A0AAV4NA63_CAEEX|nr:hypothetical protein CEXT_455671 [Caerostris extrusa]